MSSQPVRSYLVIAAAIVIAGVLIFASVFVAIGGAKTLTSTSTYTSTATTTSIQTTLVQSTTTLVQTSTTTSNQVSTSTFTTTITSTSTEAETSTSFECTITGEPAGVFFRVLSDSNQTPVAGALVVATNQPADCGTSQATAERTVNLTTSAATQWYPLDSNDNFGYSFLVAYSGQTYAFQASLRPASVTCATLYVPSGKTNVTITEFQGSCPLPTGSPSSIKLQLSVNASGGVISINADDFNTLPHTNNVTAANEWVVALNYTDGAPCGDDTYAQNPTVGFAIAKGYYTSSNVTEAELLDLVNPNATYNCPLYLGYANPTGFLFQPLSDMATSYGCDQQSCMSGSASTGVSGSGAVTGYWNKGGTFTSFPKGTYTVLAEDQWGQYTLAYFTIS